MEIKKIIPSPPPPPIGRVLISCGAGFCKKCGSSLRRTGFLRLWGAKKCINKQCSYNK